MRRRCPPNKRNVINENFTRAHRREDDDTTTVHFRWKIRASQSRFEESTRECEKDTELESSQEGRAGKFCCAGQHQQQQNEKGGWGSGRQSGLAHACARADEREYYNRNLIMAP